MSGAVIILAFEFFILAAICVWLLHHYVSFKKTPWYALITTWLGWLLCFSIVFLIPIDILNMDYDNCMDRYVNITNSTNNSTNNSTMMPTTLPTPIPTGAPTNLSTTSRQNIRDILAETMIDNATDLYYSPNCSRPITSLPDSYMEKQWAVLWWGTMLLSWLVFPILSSFFQAAHFSTWERCVRAIKENIILYCVLGVIGGIAMIGLILWKRLTKSLFLGLIMSIANAYGLVLTVILMGYGLVDLPRYLWRKANRSRTLRYYCVMAYKYKEGIEEAKADLLKTLKLVKALSDRINDHDPYRIYIDNILTKCPVDYEEVTGEGDMELTYDKLVSVHQRVLQDSHSVARAVCLYEQMLKKAFKTEDIIRTRAHKQAEWKVYWSFKLPRTHRFAKLHDAWEYIWQIYLFTTILRVAAIFFGIMSILIVWSEITLTADKHNLSPFAHTITGIPLTGFAKQLFCLIVIFYMTLCAYTTLFKIKLFNFYRLVPHQMSDAGSVMFSANYLCRLAAPLAYNFLSIVHIGDSNFTAVMGDMNATGLGRDFMIGFPILVAVLCLAALFNVYSKIGAICCIKALRYRPDDDEMLIDAGEKILSEARETKEGKVQMSTKETWKSSIKQEVGKLAKNQSEDRLLEKDAQIQIQEPLSPIPEAAPPATVFEAMAQKYGHRAQADLLPSTSRFAKRTSLDASAASSSSIRANLSTGDLSSADQNSNSGAGMKKNLSNVNLPSQGAPNTGNAFSKFLSTKPTAPPSTSATTTLGNTPQNTTLNVPSSSHTRKPSNYDSLLPPTSRFAQKMALSPAAEPAAILSSSPSNSDYDSPTAKSDTKSLLGGLFGKSKFELIPKSPNNR